MEQINWIELQYILVASIVTIGIEILRRWLDKDD